VGGLELYGTHRILVFPDDVNLLSENINAIKKRTDALLDIIMGVGREN
jgi:hypothetical protein